MPHFVGCHSHALPKANAHAYAYMQIAVNKYCFLIVNDMGMQTCMGM